MRVLVTGATGFIGGHVVARLVERGHAVVATGRNAAKLAELPARIALRSTADLSRDALEPLVEGCDAVVHCAALAAPWGDRERFVRDNVLTTERLLDASRRAGSVRRFVHVSSPSIYFKPADQLDLRENFTPPQRWPTHYGESKWESECRVREPEFGALGPVILRPRAVFGVGDTAIVPRLLAVARRGFFPLVRNGEALVDVTYVENVVDAIELALRAPRAVEGSAFNLTNGEPIRVRELLDNLFGALDLRVRFVPLPLGLAQALAGAAESINRLRRGQPEPRVTRYGLGLLSYSQTLSIDAARNDLGYAPRITTRAGIERSAAWYARHG